MRRTLIVIFAALLLANGVRHFFQHELVWAAVYGITGVLILGAFVMHPRKHPPA